MGIPHDYGNAWVFYLIAPVILSGILAGMWLIVRGAIGLLEHTPGAGYDRRCAGSHRARTAQVRSAFDARRSFSVQ
jgi:hypothetical protein